MVRLSWVVLGGGVGSASTERHGGAELLPRPRSTRRGLQMGSGGPRWARAGLRWARAGGALRLRRFLEVAVAVATKLGPGTAALQLACSSRAAGASRAHLGPAGPRRGLVCSCCSVRSMTAFRRWRWAPPAWLRGCCPPSRRCRVPPSHRPRASIHEETVMVFPRSCWRVLVGGETWWWYSVAPGFFFVDVGREKSLSACSALTRCRLCVAPFVPGGRRGNPMSTLLGVPGETLGPVWSGQQRRVDGATSV